MTTKTFMLALMVVVLAIAMTAPALAEINESVNVNMTVINNPVNMNVTGTVITGTDGLVLGFITFMLALSALFFVMPSLFGSFSQTEWVNMAFVRGSYVVGFFILFFTNASIGDMMTTLVPSVAGTAWFVFEVVGVILEIILAGFVAMTLYDVTLSVGAERKRKRMGGE